MLVIGEVFQLILNRITQSLDDFDPVTLNCSKNIIMGWMLVAVFGWFRHYFMPNRTPYNNNLIAGY